MSRIPYWKHLTEAYDAYRRAGSVVAERGGLDPKLVELVKARASQINGCGFCLDMHVKDALAGGEDSQRLHLLPAWREAPCYTDQEKAALAWTEAVTRISDGPPSDGVYQELARHFTPDEIVALSWQIVIINGWNRMAVSFQVPFGDYVSRNQPTTH